MNTIEKIHNDFDVAIHKLEKIAEDRKKEAESMKEPEKEIFYDDAEFLDNLGFKNVSIVGKNNNYKESLEQTVRNKKSKIETSEVLRENIEFFSNKFPFHKFILYSQVINICEDYNLYLGPVDLYKGNIPKKNIDEIKAFPFEVYKSVYFRRNLFFGSSDPICSQSGISSMSDKVSLYICAPYNEFEHKKTMTTGKEIYHRDFDLNPLNVKIPKKMPKDPIVLLPVKAKGLRNPGFIVITKWGKEAEDSRLVVPKNN